jgi:hypothetical protein
MVGIGLDDPDNYSSAKLADFKAASEPGLHRVQWDLQRKRGDESSLVPAGGYLVRLHVGDRILTRKLQVETEQ